MLQDAAQDLIEATEELQEEYLAVQSPTEEEKVCLVNGTHESHASLAPVVDLCEDGRQIPVKSIELTDPCLKTYGSQVFTGKLRLIHGYVVVLYIPTGGLFKPVRRMDVLSFMSFCTGAMLAHAA